MKLRSLIVSIAASAAFIGLASADDKARAPEMFDFKHVSCSGAPNEIRIVVEGIKKSVGLISVDLYPADDEKFLKGRHKIGRTKAAAKSPRTALCMEAPQAGEYAIAVYHDENANQTFDKGAFGLPIEPWGISNNPKVRFGPPHVNEALFPVTNSGANVMVDLN